MPAYPIWAYYAHGRQRRCQEDPVSLPSGRLEKTTRSSPHHLAQHRPTGSETTSPYAPRSSRFGSEPPSVEDDVDVWRYAIVRVACQKRRRRKLIRAVADKPHDALHHAGNVLSSGCAACYNETTKKVQPSNYAALVWSISSNKYYCAMIFCYVSLIGKGKIMCRSWQKISAYTMITTNI